MTESDYVRNVFGIRVRKCCASCALKRYKSFHKRICILDNKHVEASWSCMEWQMTEGLKNAGRKSGVVKDIVTKEVIL